MGKAITKPIIMALYSTGLKTAEESAVRRGRNGPRPGHQQDEPLEDRMTKHRDLRGAAKKGSRNAAGKGDQCRGGKWQRVQGHAVAAASKTTARIIAEEGSGIAKVRA